MRQTYDVDSDNNNKHGEDCYTHNHGYTTFT